MEKISFEGESYVKAVDLARELGYTSDYVGQLCRSGKVKARLVGRSWYVSPDSIRQHKRGRYRRSTAKSKAAVQKELEVRSESARKTHGAHQTHTPASGSRKLPVTIQYESDTTELIPTRERESFPEPLHNEVFEKIEPEVLKVVDTGLKYNVFTTPKPEIKFSGALKVQDADESTDFDDVSEASPERKKPLAHASLNKSKPLTATAKPQSVKIDVAVQPVRSRRWSLATTLSLVLLILVSGAMAVLTVGLEVSVLAEGDSTKTSYHFNQALVIDTLKYSLK